MKMELTEGTKRLFTRTAEALTGSARRVFMAGVVQDLGKGGQRRAETELGWNRGTIRKGQHELGSGVECVDNFSTRGRKRAEEHLPNLLEAIQAIAGAQSQTDPTFETTRLYTRLTAAEIRQQLALQKGYREDALPTEETIRVKVNQLDYRLRNVQKSRPQKKLPETDAIFDQLDKLHTVALADPSILRLSLDAKATVLIGPFSRHGQTRVVVRAMDHDFRPDQTLTPWGIFLPEHNELYLYFTASTVTADFMVDCLQDFWQTVGDRFPLVATLLLNQDNGPENHSRRTQFMKRMTEFADQFQLTVQLAYYPPYHSKYNPIERVWGVLEQHWNGSLLDTIETVLKFAQTMTWNGVRPVVELVKKAYEKGIKLTKKEMDELEKRFERLSGLDKWFVKIAPIPQALLG
jgi:transposase